MLKHEVIVVGKAYVNEDAGVIREVVEDVDGRRVRFNTFDLETGTLIPAPPQVCHKSRLARWADRAARPYETARVHPYAPRMESLPPEQGAAQQLERLKARVGETAAGQTFHRW